MKRRQFCLGVGSALLLGASPWWARRGFCEGAGEGQLAAAFPEDADPIGGYNLKPPQQYLFTDLRHIDVGDLTWRGPDGKALQVAGPPEPPVTAIADLGIVPRGIRLQAQAAAIEGPLPESPSEVHYDNGIYRGWDFKTIYPEGQDKGSYSTAPPVRAELTALESPDGYEWTKKSTSPIDVSGLSGVEPVSVFVDPHAKPEERYKGIFHAKVIRNPAAELWQQYQKVHPRYRDVRLNANTIFCLFGVVSPDGLHWTQIREPLTIHFGDTDNGVYYDEWLGKYVLYTRLYLLQRRLIARAESDDFRHWSTVQPLIWPNLEDPFYTDIYTNARTTYPGLPAYHLMFPEFYNRFRQTSEIRLYSSYDGISWNSVPGGPVVAPGDPGQWNGEYLAVSRHLVPLRDRVAIRLAAYDHPHKYPRWKSVFKRAHGWASWPKGRLCGLVADEEGEFTTFQLPVTGRELRINARVRRAGEVRVGLRNIAGRDVGDCDPIFGDISAHTITWKGNSSLGEGPLSEVRLHFKLRSAELYGLEFV